MSSRLPTLVYTCTDECANAFSYPPSDFAANIAAFDPDEHSFFSAIIATECGSIGRSVRLPNVTTNATDFAA